MTRRVLWISGLLIIGWMVSAAGPRFDASPSPSAIQPSITLSVTSGPPGTAVTITGRGFPPTEIVALYIDQPLPYLDRPGPRADAQGSFRIDIKTPDSNYDPSGRVKPAAPGPHNICGDTAYPGSTQPVAAKACAQFQVQALPSTSSSPGAGNATSPSGASLPEVLVAMALLLAAVAGMFLWLRRR